MPNKCLCTNVSIKIKCVCVLVYVLIQYFFVCIYLTCNSINNVVKNNCFYNATMAIHNKRKKLVLINLREKARCATKEMKKV